MYLKDFYEFYSINVKIYIEKMLKAVNQILKINIKHVLKLIRHINKKIGSRLCSKIVNYVIVLHLSQWNCRPVLKQLCKSPDPRTSTVSVEKG